MKLVLASPTYGPVDPDAAKSLRVAIMHASQNGVEWLGDASPDRMFFSVARNVAAKEAVSSEADGVFWCDSDVILPAHAITSLVKAQRDFICGIYFQRNPPYFPLIANFNPRGVDGGKFNWLSGWPVDTVAPIDGCGFGCVLTSTSLLRKMAAPWFEFTKFSEDFDFCLKAAKVGGQLHVHTGVLCEHLGDAQRINADTFQTYWKQEQERLAAGIGRPVA
jgi:GT2 family glycosyltransferase